MSMKNRFALTALCVLALGLPSVAQAGTKYQSNLTPDTAASDPGFSAKGSSIKIDDLLRVKGKIKGVIDGGMVVTTDPLDAGDDYYVEIDVRAVDTGNQATVTIFFDLKNGNGKFSAVLTISLPVRILRRSRSSSPWRQV